MYEKNCPFCSITSGNSHQILLYQDNLVTAFKDIHPITPVHILVVPNRHVESLNDIAMEDEALLGHMITVAKGLAKENRIDRSGYRLVINAGPDSGQSVFHLHLHLIGGRHMPFKFQ